MRRMLLAVVLLLFAACTPQEQEAKSPQAGAQTAQAPGAEMPKAQTPPAEVPKAETVPAEVPKAETPKTETPPAEAPKAGAPEGETPPGEAPKAGQPKADTPPTQAPGAETPKPETPPDASGAAAGATLGDATEGQLRYVDKDGRELVLPLKHTKVDAEVSGTLAGVWVTQQFGNPLDHPIEAVYVFPLPNMAAVDDMEMVIGKRVIRGVMKEREEARRTYEEAKAAGKTASLLEQDRPNIFTQSVANILPGDDIRIRIHYVEAVKYESGQYEFVFPMVVGPRYIPGTPTGAQAGGWAADTNRVPDASRITPPVLKPGERSGHDIEVNLALHAGMPLQDPTSPSHEIVVTRNPGDEVLITLKPFDTIPNKDLTVRYRSVGQDLEVAALTHAGPLGSYFALLFQPESAPKDEVIVARELVFVLDTSGSMSGDPIAESKEAVKKAIKTMRPDDTFNVFEFSNSARGFAPAPVAVTAANMKDALQFVDQLEGEGGTEMLTGISAALDYPLDPKRIRIVNLMTDGFIGNEDEVLKAVEGKLRTSRLFSFGIGSSVNRFLLDKLAQVGRGQVTYVRQDESPDLAVERFFRSIATPLLVDIDVSVQGPIQLTEMYPMPVRDLFSGEPLVVNGRFEGVGPATILVTGRRGNVAFRKEIPLTFPRDQPANAVLATLWARQKIEYLMSKMTGGEDPDIKAKVLEVAQKYRVMSKYTSFVAVEEKVRTDGTSAETVQVPVEMPEGVSHKGVFGDSGTDGARMMRAKSVVSQKTLVGVLGSPDGVGGGAFADSLAEAPGSSTGGVIQGPKTKMEVAHKVEEVKFQISLSNAGTFKGGKIDKAELNKYLRARRAGFQQCYLQIARRNPNAGGKLVLRLKIEPTGRATATVEADLTGDPAIAQCILGKMKGWTFPKPEGKAVEFTVPFVFRSEQGAPAKPYCTVKLDFVAVLEGPQSEKPVKDALSPLLTELQSSLEASGAKKPETGFGSANLALNLHVDASGLVSLVRPKHAAPGNAIEAHAMKLLAAKIAQWKFPAFPRPSDIKASVVVSCSAY